MRKNKSKKIDEIKIDNIDDKNEGIKDTTIDENKDISKDIIIDETKSIDNIDDKDNSEIEDELKEVKKSKKEMCKIVVATPTYYVVNKDGVSITINKKNNFRRGDETLI